MISKYNSIFAVFAALFITTARAQGPTVSWLKTVDAEGVSVIAVDAAGNFYSSGVFTDTVDFDPGPGIYNLVSNGNYDIFFQKLDPNGNLLWANSIGSNSLDIISGITVDAAGDLYATGMVYDTIDFDPGPGVFSQPALYDIFILKLSSAGNFVWASAIGSNGYESGNEVALDGAGNLYVNGHFSDTVDFDPGTGTANLISNNGTDIFIAKYDTAGNFGWAKSFGGGEYDLASSLSVDAAGNSYVAGTFKDTVDFDHGAGVLNLAADSLEDAFLMKTDPLGNFVWVKLYSGNKSEYIQSTFIDGAGNIYLVGNYDGTIDLDPGAGTNIVACNGGNDFFIQKLDNAGNITWTKTFGDAGYDYAIDVSVDASGNIYTTGEFGGTVDFDGGPGIYNLSSAWYMNMFIYKMDASGNFVWAEALNGDNHTIGRKIIVTGQALYVTGDSQGNADMAPGPGVVTVSTPINDYAVVFLKLNECGTYSVLNQSACGSFTWQGNTYSATGQYSDTLSNVAGCDSVAYLNLTMNDPDTTVSITLSDLISNQSGATYQWLDCNNGNAPIPGENAQTYTPALPGDYAVIVTFSGCTDTTMCHTMVITGIPENFSEMHKIFPNPNNGNFSVASSINENLVLVNSLGQVIQSLQLNGNTKVEIKDLENGIYFLISGDGHKIMREKIVVLK
jgi:hypothetical protein